MFENISEKMLQRMKYLEEIDTKDRTDGTPRMERLRQIPPDTGKFISLLAAGSPEGEMIEIGTSAGYSTLWLTLAARHKNKKITTFEILQDKAELARETFKLTGVEKDVNFIFGDALEYLQDYKNISFCFLDAEKEVYESCYDLVVPNLLRGGLLVIDNAISHQAELSTFLEKVNNDPRVDSVIVPIGKGELICRKV